MEGTKKRCFIEMFRGRYGRSGKKSCGQILDEVSEALGIGRRQARRLMGARIPGRPRNPHRRGRPSKYGTPEFQGALKLMWGTMRYMCSRHMRAGMAEWLRAVEEDRGAFPKDIREKLVSISAATIDRILKPYKALKGKSLTRSGGFRDEIPIQENIWSEQRPGFIEADTVHHCGGSTFGEYLSTLNSVDIATVWTETRAVFGRASGPIVKALEDIENRLPFDLLGYDVDNGSEVLNSHILRYLRDERLERGRPQVQVTRSREYKKNDQAYIEQRNDSVPRRWLGYERIDFEELVPLVNHYFRDIVCPMMNHFFPTFKLADKKRIKSRTRRIYKDPVTPYARVIASPEVSEERKNALRQEHAALNPLRLSRQEKLVRKQIDDTLKVLRNRRASAQKNTINHSSHCNPPHAPTGAALTAANVVAIIRVSNTPTLHLRK